MKSVADWLQRGYTEAVLMETGMRRNECMKRLSKVSCGLLLTASLLIGAMLSGCGQTTDYTAEIKEYQNKLESLAAENEELKAQLGITETQRLKRPRLLQRQKISLRRWCLKTRRLRPTFNRRRIRITPGTK